MATKKKAVAPVATKEPTFDKASLVDSKHFRNHKDIVSALLEDGKTYTIMQADEVVSKYLKGMVN